MTAALTNACFAACATIGVSLTFSTTAQTPAPGTPPERPLLRIGTTLVEIDAVVADKQGTA